jgi:hypothetical protein
VSIQIHGVSFFRDILVLEGFRSNQAEEWRTLQVRTLATCILRSIQEQRLARTTSGRTFAASLMVIRNVPVFKSTGGADWTVPIVSRDQPPSTALPKVPNRGVGMLYVITP